MALSPPPPPAPITGPGGYTGDGPRHRASTSPPATGLDWAALGSGEQFELAGPGARLGARIKVVRADSGSVPGAGKSVIRWIIPAAAAWLPVGNFLISPLVYISLLWDSNRQGWHDKAARTLVVKARSRLDRIESRLDRIESLLEEMARQSRPYAGR